MDSLRILDLGRVPYTEAMDLQHRWVRRLQAQRDEPAAMLLLEHDPPVITLGRRGRREDILASPEQLEAERIQVHHCSRGGQATYHGPGQLVAYPIVRVGRAGRSVRRYVRDLEQAVIDVLKRLGLGGRRRQGHPGVWADGGKMASVGISVKRWIAYHGVALNVSTDERHLGYVVSCGMPDASVTTISRQLGRSVSVEEIKPIFVERFCDVMNFSPTEADAPLLEARPCPTV